MITCPECAVEQSESSKFCSECGTALRPEVAATASLETADRLTDEATSGSADSSLHGRFLPGSKIADRYRIVSLLGRGGMGEVYRADDLKLGQTVALKFLPPDLAERAHRLEYFHSEVRLTRQVSHPNVCRVYDIGFTGGHHFLSMEYIDGEDLRALLRRIGRLPVDKGVEIARQLCAGLAAAHDRGVVHRDLKPANIMIDGRGQVRITDFGLARLNRESDAAETAGTPAYMAPEQLASGETSFASDIFSLGLILYELFTGEALRTTNSVAELRRDPDKLPPTLPSNVVDNLGPIVEQVIQGCLSKRPEDRPKSARSVAAALPGGDPLAAALAAGETPSPGLVAAAGEIGTIHPAIGIAMLAALFAGFAAVLGLAYEARLHNLAPLETKPDVLVDRAQEMVRSFGFEGEAVNAAHGFGFSPETITWLQTNGSDSHWRNQLHRRGPAPVYFWYRDSRHPLVPARGPTRSSNPTEWGVNLDDPPLNVPGMISVVLDPSGRLLEFASVPARSDVDSRAARPTPDPTPELWHPLMRAADLDPELLVERAAIGPFPVYADQVKAWTAVGLYPDFPSAEIRVEAASFAGRPVYFRAQGPWDRPGARVASGRSPAPSAGDVPTIALNVLLLVAGVIIAVHNLRLGRGDRKGATRLAILCFVAWMGAWLFAFRHGFSSDEYTSAMDGLKGAVFGAVEVWVYYIALEPYVRRLWPSILISWARLWSGRFDPMVGRDVLAGACAGVAFVCIEMLIVAIPGWLGHLTSRPSSHGILLLGREGGSIAYFLSTVPFGVKAALFYITLTLLVLRIALRKEVLAMIAFVAWNTYYFASVADPLFLSTPLYALGFGLVVVILIRHGLLAIAAMWMVRNSLAFPLAPPHVSAWYGRPGLIVIGVIAAIAAYALWKAVGRTASPAMGSA